jgi:hypothetical protein
MNCAVAFPRVGNFLMLGKCDDELHQLEGLGWKGICVVPPRTFTTLNDEQYYGNITYIEALLSNDSHFTRVMEGYWVKPLTIEDIFRQYGSWRFDLIIIKVEMMTRYLWYDKTTQDHLPRWYLIEEDGHNEGVIKVAQDRGYDVYRDGDWLIMRHNRAAEDELLTEAEKGKA